jgi:phage head maturation protease
MNPIRTRAFLEEANEADAPLRFVIASKGEKRDGLDLEMNRFEFGAFNRNPVMLWQHGREPTRGALPIGRWQALERNADRITGEAVFDAGDAFAMEIARKYREGYLNAVSVSWLPQQTRDGWRYEMLEASAVSVPADPDALALGRDFDAVIREFERTEQQAILDEIERQMLKDAIARSLRQSFL